MFADLIEGKTFVGGTAGEGTGAPGRSWKRQVTDALGARERPLIAEQHDLRDCHRFPVGDGDEAPPDVHAVGARGGAAV